MLNTPGGTADSDANAVEYRYNSAAPIVATGNDNLVLFFGAKSELVMFALPESGR